MLIPLKIASSLICLSSCSNCSQQASLTKDLAFSPMMTVSLLQPTLSLCPSTNQSSSAGFFCAKRITMTFKLRVAPAPHRPSQSSQNLCAECNCNTEPAIYLWQYTPRVCFMNAIATQSQPYICGNILTQGMQNKPLVA